MPPRSGQSAGVVRRWPDAVRASGSDASSAGVKSGNAQIDFQSDGTRFAGGTLTDLGVTNVAVTGKVYTPAVANITTPALNFGVVHVGDTVAQAIGVNNAAAVTALNDTLTGAIASTTGGVFSGSGTLGGGVAAGATDSSSLKIGLNTANSGTFSGQANLALFSHDPDLADLALATSPVTLTATVDNYAVAAFQKDSGAGGFSGSGGSFVLNFGNVTQGSGIESTALAVFNAATGLSDLLGGNLSVASGAGDFALAGLGAFSGLGAGQAASAFVASFDPTATGSLREVIDLTGTGSNASGYTQPLNATLLLEANVVPGGGGTNVPEPGTLGLLGGALAALLVARRRRRD